MDKKQRAINNPLVFFATALLIILITFLLFSPRVSSYIFPFKRQMVFDSFIKNTKQADSVNPQEFWKFREFYSPGYFEFSEKGIKDMEYQDFLSKTGLTAPENIDIYFSIFKSKHLTSIEGLTEESLLVNILGENSKSVQSVIFANDKSIIYKTKDGKTFIIFVLPVSKMRKANGFFEYDGRDKNLLENKNWFNLTQINP